MHKIIITRAAWEHAWNVAGKAPSDPSTRHLPNGDVVIQIDDDVYAELHRLAVETGRSLSEVILLA